MRRLADNVAETASWVSQLGEMAGSLAGSLNEWTEANRKAIATNVGQPLADLLTSGSASSRRWVRLLLLESPEVRRALEVVLIEKISEHGVFRDVSDLQEIGASTVGCFVAATLRPSERDAARIMEFVGECLEQQTAHVLASADATLLGMMLQPDELEGLSRVIRHEELAEVLELAYWTAVLSAGNSEREKIRCPSTWLGRAWFETHAYRGLRRHWARQLGLVDGAADVTSLPAWLSLSEQSDLMPEGYGAMVVEWAIAAIRHWPNREQMLHDDLAELRGRANTLGTQAATLLERCEGGGELTEWLRTSLRELVTVPVTDRRLFRHAH